MPLGFPNAVVIVTGLKNLKRRFYLIERDIREKAIHAGLTAALAPILVTAVGLVPKDTGTLSRSLGFKLVSYRRGKLWLGILGPRRGFKWGRSRSGNRAARYAHIIEHGSRHRAARPYMRPAWDAHKAAIPSHVARGVRRHLAHYGINP